MVSKFKVGQEVTCIDPNGKTTSNEGGSGWIKGKSFKIRLIDFYPGSHGNVIWPMDEGDSGVFEKYLTQVSDWDL